MFKGSRHSPTVPATWRSVKLKHWLRLNAFTLGEDTPPEFDFDYVDIGAVGQGRLVAQLEHLNFGNAPSRARRVVHSGDTLVSTVRTYLKATVNFDVVERTTIASTGFAVLSPRALEDSLYVGYVVQGQQFLDCLTSGSVGIAYPAINESKLGNVKVLVPPLDEQTAIVKYLRHAHARIDRAIAAKRKLIALLDEQKLAIVHQAVTRGLDPSAPLKDSGIPWLGQIPATWGVRRAKYLFKEFDIRSGTGEERLLSLRALAGLVFHDEFSTRLIGPEVLSKYKKVSRGQLVMNRMRAASGLFAVATAEGLVSPDYSTMEVSDAIEASYFLRLFKTRAAMSEFRRRSTGLGTGESGFMRLYSDEFGRMPLPLPPLADQRAIAQYVGELERDGNAIAIRTFKEIELLREFRTRLTSDVVTGQVDVREIAATLPELSDDALDPGDEPFDDDDDINGLEVEDADD